MRIVKIHQKIREDDYTYQTLWRFSEDVVSLITCLYTSLMILHSTNDEPAQIDMNNNYIILCRCWFKFGVLHRDNDEPAIILYDNDGVKNAVREERWMIEGELRREDNTLPSIVGYHSNGTIISKIWNQDNVYRGPTTVLYYETGVLRMEIWKIGDIISRSGDRPAVISYSRDGMILSIEYIVDGERHRDYDKPAVVISTPVGRVHKMEWYIRGKRRRIDSNKPIKVFFSDNGEIDDKFYSPYII